MAGSALIGQLAVNLTMETAAFNKGADYAQKRLAGLQKKFSKMGESFRSFGKGMSLGVTLPLAAFGTKAFNAASDAQELQAAFNETFGAMSKDMNAWAVATGDAMGRSTQEIQQGAQTFGLYFNQAAKTREEAAKMSQTFTVLAQDLASFHNTDVQEAVNSLRSGLSGESEPLRKFGVFLSEAAVQAKAAELGIGQLGQKLTDQEKIAVRYALIMESTASAQGDVARTSDSTANQLRASQAAFDELAVVVGTKLLPALTPLIGLVGRLLEKFTSLSSGTQTFIIAAAAIGAVIGPVAIGIGGLVSGIGALIPIVGTLATFFTATLIPAAIATAPIWAPIAIAVAAVGAAVGAVYLAFKNWDKITAFAKSVYMGVKAWIQDKLAKVFEFVTEKVKAVGDAFYKLWDRVVGHSYVPDMVDAIGEHFERLDGVMLDPATAATDGVSDAFSGMAGSVESSIGRIGKALGSGDWKGAVGGVLDVLAGSGGTAGKIGSIGKSIFGGFFANGGNPPVGKLSVVGENGPEFIKPRGRMTVIPGGGIGGGIVVNQTIAPNFAGNAATKQDVVQMGQIARESAIAGVKEAISRRGAWR